MEPATFDEARIPTRERQRQDTRRRIFAAAVDEIRSHGLAGAQVGRIAIAAGVSRPTVYAHFPTKDDFVREIERSAERKTLARVQETLPAASSVQELLDRLVDALFDVNEGVDAVLRKEVYALVVREAMDVDWAGDGFYGYLSDRFELALARGEITTSMTPPEITRVVMTGLFGFLMVDNAPVADRRRSARRLVDLLLVGLEPR